MNDELNINPFSVITFIEQREKEAEQKIKQERTKHKCHKCIWARWESDTKVLCAMPACVKGKY